MKKYFKLFSAISLFAIMISGCSAKSNENYDNVDSVLNTTYTVKTVAEHGEIEGAKTVYLHGENALLTAKADEGFEFYAWEIEGINVGILPTLTYTIREDTTFVAIFLNSEITYKFVEEDDITFLPASINQNPNDVIGREPNEVYGKIVKGWSNPVFVEEGLAVVNARYDFDSSVDQTITINGTETVVHYGEEITAVAKSTDFTYWSDENDNIISYDSFYKFKAYGSQTLVERNNVIADPVPSITMTSCVFSSNVLIGAFSIAGPTFVGGSNSTDYGIIDAGMYLTPSEYIPTFGNKRVLKANNVNENGQFIIKYTLTGTANKNLVASGFVRYVDNNENEVEKYTTFITIKNAYVGIGGTVLWDKDLQVTAYRGNGDGHLITTFASGIDAETATNKTGYIYYNGARHNQSGFNGVQSTTQSQFYNNTSACSGVEGQTFHYIILMTFNNSVYGSHVYVNSGALYTLANYKTAKQTELTTYFNNLELAQYDQAGKDTITSIKNRALAAITAPTNWHAIDQIIDAVKADVELVPLDLDLVKSVQKNKLDEYLATKDEADYSTTNYFALEEIVRIAKENIDIATTIAQVTNIVNQAKRDMDAVELSLDTYKTLAIDELNQYAIDKKQSKYTEENWDELLRRRDTGIININLAVSRININSALTSAKQEIDKVEKKYELLSINGLWVENANLCHTYIPFATSRVIFVSATKNGVPLTATIVANSDSECKADLVGTNMQTFPYDIELIVTVDGKPYMVEFKALAASGGLNSFSYLDR